jgi:hypothetical protein
VSSVTDARFRGNADLVGRFVAQVGVADGPLQKHPISPLPLRLTQGNRAASLSLNIYVQHPDIKHHRFRQKGKLGKSGRNGLSQRFLDDTIA